MISTERLSYSEDTKRRSRDGFPVPLPRDVVLPLPLYSSTFNFSSIAILFTELLAVTIVPRDLGLFDVGQRRMEGN
jgi:hypothetical protein